MAEKIFELIEAGLKADASIAKKVGASFSFDLDTGSGNVVYLLDLKSGNGSVKKGSGTAECNIKMKESDFLELMSGKLNGQQAFMGGKLKVTGNMMLAMKLEELTKALKNAPQPSKTTSSTPTTNSSAPGVADVFSEIEQGIKADSSVVGKINGIYKFVITGTSSGDQTWIVDLKTAPGSVKQTSGNGDVTLTLKEADFTDLMTGKLDGQSAFMQGKLKISGNMGLAMKLSQIVVQKKAKL